MTNATRQSRCSVGSPSCWISSRLRSLLAHAPDSGSTGAEIVRWAADHRSQLLASYLLFAAGLAVLMVFAAGLHRIIRSAENKDGWLATASSGERGRRRWDLWCRHRAVHGRCVPPSHRSGCGTGVMGRRLAGVQHRGVRVQRVDRDHHRSHAPRPRTAGLDGMDRGTCGADRLRRSVRGEGGNRCVFSPGLVRAGRRLYLRCLANRHVSRCVAIDPHPSGESLTAGAAGRTSDQALRFGRCGGEAQARQRHPNRGRAYGQVLTAGSSSP